MTDELKQMFKNEPFVKIGYLLDEIHKIAKSCNFKGKVELELGNSYSKFNSKVEYK